MNINASMGVQKDDLDNDDIVNVAKEIVEYLHEHPNAADSLDGVVNWWLTRQRIKSAKKTVEQALDYLINEGVVNKKTHEGNEPIYSNINIDDKLIRH